MNIVWEIDNYVHDWHLYGMCVVGEMIWFVMSTVGLGLIIIFPLSAMFEGFFMFVERSKKERYQAMLLLPLALAIVLVLRYNLVRLLFPFDMWSCDRFRPDFRGK